MEAKALTTQDLTSDLTTHPASVGLDGVALDAMALDAVALTVAAEPADLPAGLQDTDLSDDIPAELVTVATSTAIGPAFDQFGIAEPICAALTAAGITNAFPIQALTLPIALEQHDVIGQARTGTGKTLAFAIPILQHLIGTPRGKAAAPRALVVVPTRELAIQVAEDLRTTDRSARHRRCRGRHPRTTP